MEFIRREFIYLWYYFTVQFEQIFPYWVLGMVLVSVVSVFLKDRIHSTFRSLSEKKLGVFGIFIASALGIASPLCMYGTIPNAASFSKSGIKDDWLAAFMMSSIHPHKRSLSEVLSSTGSSGNRRPCSSNSYRTASNRHLQSFGFEQQKRRAYRPSTLGEIDALCTINYIQLG